MDVEKTVYINNQFCANLYSSDYYNDRPEFHRHHLQTLQDIYQQLKAGDKQAVIVNTSGIEGVTLKSAWDFRHWVSQTYPGLQYKLL